MLYDPARRGRMVEPRALSSRLIRFLDLDGGYMQFQGKVVLVTGGASGIGLATCRGFAQAGAFVLLTDVDAEKGERAAGELRSEGGLVQFRALDVTERVSAETVAAHVRSDPGRLDVLV